MKDYTKGKAERLLKSHQVDEVFCIVVGDDKRPALVRYIRDGLGAVREYFENTFLITPTDDLEYNICRTAELIHPKRGKVAVLLPKYLEPQKNGSLLHDLERYVPAGAVLEHC